LLFYYRNKNIHNKVANYSKWYNTYLLKIFPETCRVHLIGYLRFYWYRSVIALLVGY
jgi:hypothetical protein